MNYADTLAATLAREMRRTSQANQKTVLDFGTIGTSLSLVTDRLRVSIPAGSYSVLRDLRPEGDPPCEYGGCALHGDPQLTVGDRVLVAWVGNEPVVVGKIT